MTNYQKKEMKYLSNQGFIMQSFEEITFEKFYKLYPRKVGRFMASKSFKKLSSDDKVLAYNGLLNYIKFWKCNKTEKQFIPHPSTWLNQRRWEDELDLPKSAKEKSKDIRSEVIQYRKKQKELLDNSADTDDIKDALSGFLGKGKWKRT